MNWPRRWVRSSPGPAVSTEIWEILSDLMSAISLAMRRLRLLAIVEGRDGWKFGTWMRGGQVRLVGFWEGRLEVDGEELCGGKGRACRQQRLGGSLGIICQPGEWDQQGFR